MDQICGKTFFGNRVRGENLALLEVNKYMKNVDNNYFVCLYFQKLNKMDVLSHL
jgi:hypothetical protein